MSKSLDSKALVDCGADLVKMMGLELPAHLLRQIGAIIREQEVLEKEKENLITKREAARLLLAHLQTTLLREVGKSILDVPKLNYSVLEEKTERALFGPKFTDYPVEIVRHDDYFCAFLPDFGFSACGATGDDQDAALYVLETVFEGVAAHYASVGRALPTPSTFEQVTEWPRPANAREQRDIDGKLLLSHVEAVDRYRAALGKINEIRNSIVGLQSINWSAHIYPLVAALDEAGMEGMPYDKARPHYISLLDRVEQAEAHAAVMREALLEHKRHTDTPGYIERCKVCFAEGWPPLHVSRCPLASGVGKDALGVLDAARVARDAQFGFHRASLRSAEGTVGGSVVNRYNDALEALWRAVDAFVSEETP